MTRVDLRAEQSIEDGIGLRPGERLEETGSRSAGFMACDDITEYIIRDGQGHQVGTATLTEHTDVKAPHHESRFVMVFRN
jgi:hypothetical protein